MNIIDVLITTGAVATIFSVSIALAVRFNRDAILNKAARGTTKKETREEDKQEQNDIMIDRLDRISKQLEQITDRTEEDGDRDSPDHTKPSLLQTAQLSWLPLSGK